MVLAGKWNASMRFSRFNDCHRPGLMTRGMGKLKAESDLKDIPVIMLTAESGKENVMQIVKMGVKDYIVKPFKGEQLIERAKNILKLRPVE